ncbi:MAG: hypothetical protein GY865_14575 [candidate division Zixibacteria bacterium]|nr:hypothetical protein [candidate division Zixibacteria bacterium]
MDSLTVLLEQIINVEPSFWSMFFDWIARVGPLLVAVLVPYFTLRHTKKMKKLEISDSENARLFRLRHDISNKTIEVMAKSYHLVHKYNRALNDFGGADQSAQKEIYKQIIEARIYWEGNLFYLPKAVRGRVIRFTNITLTSLNPAGRSLTADAFQEVSNMFTDIERAFARLMEQYNLFDEFANEETNIK